MCADRDEPCNRGHALARSCPCAQSCLELCFTVVTPLLSTVTVAATVKIMLSFFALLLVTAAVASSNWVSGYSVVAPQGLLSWLASHPFALA